MITKSIERSIVIHEDNFTETMDGITTLLKIIKSNGNITHAPICRSILLMSHFMIENVFWNTVEKYLQVNEVDLSTKNVIKTGFQNNIGIGKAMDEWPQMLVGRCFDFSHELFSSMRCLIKERNDLAHSDRVSYYSYYIDTYKGASSAYFTAIECAKAIQKHFNGIESRIYSEFEKEYPPPEKVLFQNALNWAKKNSIQLITKEEFPSQLKTLEHYKSCSHQKFDDVDSQLFGREYVNLFNNSTNKCEYLIKITNDFYDAVGQLNDEQKAIIAKKLSPLFCTLTKKKMMHHYGINFGEVLPHIKLKIKRIAYEKHHGYMCMPAEDLLIIFIINTNSIELTDIIKIA
jgi:hypothetical protein